MTELWEKIEMTEAEWKDLPWWQQLIYADLILEEWCQ